MNDNVPFFPHYSPKEERRVSPLHPLPRPVPAPELCLQPRRGRSLQGSACVSPALVLTSLYSHGPQWQGPPLCAHKPAPPTLFVSRNYHVAVLSNKARAPEPEWKKPCDAQRGQLGGFQVWRSVTCCHGDALKRETHAFQEALLAESLTFCWRESFGEIKAKLRSGQGLTKWKSLDYGDWCCMTRRHSFFYVNLVALVCTHLYNEWMLFLLRIGESESQPNLSTKVKLAAEALHLAVEKNQWVEV